jgi:hypothetical protein
VQVGTADRTGRNFDDSIARMFDFGIRNVVAANVAFTVPSQGLHFIGSVNPQNSDAPGDVPQRALCGLGVPALGGILRLLPYGLAADRQWFSAAMTPSRGGGRHDSVAGH